MADPSSPTVHEAELLPGPSGAVERGRELTRDEAIARRRDGLDIVACGDETRANRSLARGVEAVVGPPTRAQPPEPKAGPLALPHFHQQTRDPEGRAFYETDKRKARKRK